MKTKNNGYSLVELMVAVAIIGILLAMAIPTLSGHQKKARQAEVKIALATLYKAEQIFHAATKSYYMKLVAMGYTPSGVLRYLVGFGSDHSELFTPTAYAIGDNTKEKAPDTLDICQLGFDQGSYSGVSEDCMHEAASIVGLETEESWKANESQFIAGAKGHIGGSQYDSWTIDETKKLTHIQNGGID